MKNQYFGDKRDYFKYSVLEALVLGTPRVHQLTCLWMLTAPIANNHGQIRFAPHPENLRLWGFFEDCRSRGVKDVRQMARYFQGHGYGYFSYRDQPAEYFSQANRTQYFDEIPSEALREAVVFFDPDNGLEPSQSCTSAHLGFNELSSIFDRMDAGSVAVVYQHLPRVKGSVFWRSVAAKLYDRLRAPVAFIAEGDLAFYVVPRSGSGSADILRILETLRHASYRSGGRDAGHVP